MIASRRAVALLLSLLAPVVIALPAAPPAAAAGPDRLDAFGGAVDAGAPALSPGDRYVAIAEAPVGYWLATSGGGVFSQGGAPFHGSAAGIGRSAPIVGIAARPSGDGYWLAGADGAVCEYGAAIHHGSMAKTPLRSPVVGIAANPNGDGYWLVAADGGVFAFGDAAFSGSLGGRDLAAPIVAVAAAPQGGYWLVAVDGGVFTFGGAPFLGSGAGRLLASPVIVVAPTATGDGYWLAAGDGGVLAYGAARFAGAGTPSPEAVVGIAASSGGGYHLLRAPSGPSAPAGSGSGRRVVYSNPLQRVWLVGESGLVERTYLVSGRRGVPAVGTYHVYSKSPVTGAGHDGISMRKMVRFARGDRLPIGFHDIPRYGDGRPLQRDDDLGGYRSSGCVRQGASDAAALWDWASIGTTVVVIS